MPISTVISVLYLALTTNEKEFGRGKLMCQFAVEIVELHLNCTLSPLGTLTCMEPSMAVIRSSLNALAKYIYHNMPVSGCKLAVFYMNSHL